MTLVVDASVAAKWLLPEPDADQAERLWHEELIAPPIFRLECANALIKRLRAKQMGEAEARARLEEVKCLPVTLRAVDEEDVFDLAATLRHPIYDCAYLSLARAAKAPMITADARLCASVKASALSAELSPLVIMLADYHVH